MVAVDRQLLEDMLEIPSLLLLLLLLLPWPLPEEDAEVATCPRRNSSAIFLPALELTHAHIYFKRSCFA